MAENRMRHGAIGWTELMTTDVASAKKFYGALFGWELEDMPMEGIGITYTVVKAAGEEAGGMMKMPAECEGMPPYWGVYVTVDDVDATAAQVQRLGGTILRPPMDIPGVGRFCVLQDPQGGVISAITYAHR